MTQLGPTHLVRLKEALEQGRGVGVELKVIAAAVIGGASLSGGRGTILGTLAGALLMQTIASGCTQLEIRNPVQDIILGVIIVAAVTVDQLRQRRAPMSA
jgi:ribose transport system permease protein